MKLEDHPAIRWYRREAAAGRVTPEPLLEAEWLRAICLERPDVRLRADSRSWLRFLAGELGLFRALLTGKMRLRGSPKLMKRLASCFPL